MACDKGNGPMQCRREKCPFKGRKRMNLREGQCCYEDRAMS